VVIFNINVFTKKYNKPFPILLMMCFLFCASVLHAQKDSATITRASYHALFVNYEGVDASDFSRHAYPLPALDYNQQTGFVIHRGFQAGLMGTLPFHRHFEVEAALYFELYSITGYYAAVRAIKFTSPPTVVSFTETKEDALLKTGNFSFGFNYEFLHRKKIALRTGIGEYFMLAGDGNFPRTGFEGGLCMYYNIGPHVALQLRTALGFSQGFYYTAGIALCHRGSRTVHVHPQHYYVRGYNPEE